jgi:hypothetical protein
MIKISEMIQVFKLLIIYFLTLLFFGSSFADDVYQADKNILIISAVDVGDTTFTDVSVQVQDVVTIGTSSIPNTNDIYNSATNQLTIQSVTVGSSVYKNVVVTLGKVLGVGGSQAKYQAKKLSLSSYKNSKELDFFSNDFPKDSYGYNPLLSQAFSFFYFKNGSQGLLTGDNTYSLTTQTPATASKSILTFWKKDKLIWTKSNIQINYKTPSCIQPRKILSADFNNDGLIDFAIMCHGWDAMPFPGEKSTILLSQVDGSYNHELITEDIGFWHGGASEDFNGDGYPDIAMYDSMQIQSNSFGVFVYINDGFGKFKKDNQFLIPLPPYTQVFNIELLDLNGDGKFDVLFGGHENNMPTKILLNNGTSKFNTAQEIVIPKVLGGGILTDFVYSKSNDSIYICRTGDGQNNGTVAFEGLWLQKYNLTTKLSSTLISNANWTDSRFGYPHKDLAWIKEDGGFIKSNWGEAIKVKIE